MTTESKSVRYFSGARTRGTDAITYACYPGSKDNEGVINLDDEIVPAHSSIFSAMGFRFSTKDLAIKVAIRLRDQKKLDEAIVIEEKNLEPNLKTIEIVDEKMLNKSFSKAFSLMMNFIQNFCSQGLMPNVGQLYEGLAPDSKTFKIDDLDNLVFVLWPVYISKDHFEVVLDLCRIKEGKVTSGFYIYQFKICFKKGNFQIKIDSLRNDFDLGFVLCKNTVAGKIQRIISQFILDSQDFLIKQEKSSEAS